MELLQQQLEQLKAACLLNTEKLDYNYQVGLDRTLLYHVPYV